MPHIAGHQDFSGRGLGAILSPPPPGTFPPVSNVQSPTGIPPTGLIGSEQAIQQGLGGQLGLLAQGIGGAQGEIDLATGQARQDINQSLFPSIVSLRSGFSQGRQDLDPFLAGGAGASQLQAAQSGALGPEAQAQAFQNFQQSPGQQFAIEQGRQNILRSAAATQGIGGGNVLRELNRQGIGQAQQNFQQQFQNLGQVAGRGQQIAGAQAGLASQAGLATGQVQQARGQNLANIAQQGGRDLSNLALQGGVLPAQAVGGAANQLAQGRFITGQQIAQAAGGTAAGQAGLQSQLGAGLSSQFGQGITNLANLTSGTGAQSAQLQQNLATILANIGTGAGSQAANFTNAAAQFDASGILGQNTAVQNTLQQLLQLIPQGGGGGVNIDQSIANNPNTLGTITPQG